MLTNYSIQKDKTRDSQFSVSSMVYVKEATTEDRIDLKVIVMKLRSEESLDGDEGQNVKAGAANATQLNPMKGKNLNLNRPPESHGS